jgi:hypothetical protein
MLLMITYIKAVQMSVTGIVYSQLQVDKILLTMEYYRSLLNEGIEKHCKIIIVLPLLR